MESLAAASGWLKPAGSVSTYARRVGNFQQLAIKQPVASAQSTGARSGFDFMTVTQRAQSNRYLDRPSPSSLADVIDTILNKGFVIDVYLRVHQQRRSVGAVGVLPDFKSFGARLSGLAKAEFKESGKRVKKGVKKGVKRVKSAPPEVYLAGAGVVLGGAAVLLLATTKSGRELLIRTAQLALRTGADEQASQESDVPADEQESQEANVQEDVDDEPAEDADFEDEREEDTNGDKESRVTDLKPRDQRPRSAGPGRRTRSPTKEPAPAET
jgi:hypothetical protein